MFNNFFTDKTVWITGGNGFVGKAIARRLTHTQCQLLATSRSEVDVLNQEQVLDYLSDHRPDIVFHTAAKVGNIEANSQYPADFLSQNLALGANVVNGCAQHNIGKLINLGSSCMYPKLASQPIEEHALLSGDLEPTNEGYAIAKIATLKLVECYRRQYNHDFINVIPTNLYGRGDHFDLARGHVIPSLVLRFVDAMENKRPSVTLWGSGRPEREFLYVDDAADAICFLAANYQHELPINVAGGATISIKLLAELIAHEVGFVGQILWDSTKPDGMMKKQLCSNKLLQLGWQAKTSFKQGLSATINSYFDSRA